MVNQLYLHYKYDSSTLSFSKKIAAQGKIAVADQSQTAVRPQRSFKGRLPKNSSQVRGQKSSKSQLPRSAAAGAASQPADTCQRWILAITGQQLHQIASVAQRLKRYIEDVNMGVRFSPEAFAAGWLAASYSQGDKYLAIWLPHPCKILSRNSLTGKTNSL